MINSNNSNFALAAVFLFICLLEGGALIYFNSGLIIDEMSNTQNVSGEESQDSVNVMVAAKKSFTGKIISYGKIKSYKHADLLVPTFGNYQVIVCDVIAESGRFIKKGEVVVRLDSKELFYRLESAKKEYEFQKECVSKLALAKETVSKQEFNKSEMLRDKAKSEFDAVTEMVHNLKVKAPFDGVIGLITLKRGQQVQQNQKIVNIVDTKDLGVEFMIAVDELKHIKLGEFVEIKTLNGSARCYAQIDTIVPDIDPLTSQVKIRAKLDGVTHNPIFRHNLGIQVFINKSIVNDVFIVPKSAIIEDGHSTKISIVNYTSYGYETKLIKISVIGQQNDGLAIKSTDISEGDYIIYEGVVPRDGIYVNIKNICD